MSSTHKTRAAVLAALMVVSVAAVGIGATGALAQQQQADNRDEIDLKLTSTQPHTVTGVTGLGAIDGSNILPPQVPGKDKTGKFQKLIIKSGGGLDFSGLALIPPPTSGIDRNGDESGTAIDKGLLSLLAGLEQKNNHHTLVIKLQKPVKVSVGDEIVISITEANNVKTTDAGHYTMKVIGVTADGQKAAPATVEYTIGNPAPEQPTEKNLTIKGQGSYTFYSFTASKDVKLTEGDSEDEVKNATAFGAVGPDSDSYTFTGELESFYLNGNAQVLVNGEPIDPGKIGSDLHTVTFKGQGNYATYEFNATETILTSRSLTAEDTISGNHADGAVGPGQDLYVYTGNLTDLNTTGNVKVVTGDVNEMTGQSVSTTDTEEVDEDDV